ncbi:uncharacterized protein BDZ99DRAFT_360764, partial [Mytilinidion resinicola]
RNCDARHCFCGAASAGFTPTRLLAVNDVLLRIVTGKPEHHRYAALSYCWGQISTGRDLFLTTKCNITARLSSLQMNELPQALQDAVQVSRALSVDYLWINAICIIQDDFEDWSKEASRMGTIYKHAYFTIAATDS